MSDTLDPKDWLELAKSLPVGAKQYVKHGCGHGPKLLVEHKDTGWAAWCYRCSLAGWVPHPRETTAERLARLTQRRVAEAALEADPRPPTPAIFDPDEWPNELKLWLYKAGVGKRLIKQAGFYYHEKTNRIVMPVIRDGKLVYWQARSEEKGAPKYLNPKVDKPIYKTGQGSPLVITEDILSAVKVGQETAAWSILGTSASDAFLLEIARAGSPVMIWLDPDNAGVKGSRKLKNLLSTLGCDARIIASEKDPKLYSRKEIRHFTGLDAASGA